MLNDVENGKSILTHSEQNLLPIVMTLLYETLPEKEGGAGEELVTKFGCDGEGQGPEYYWFVQRSA